MTCKIRVVTELVLQPAESSFTVKGLFLSQHHPLGCYSRIGNEKFVRSMCTIPIVLRKSHLKYTGNNQQIILHSTPNVQLNIVEFDAKYRAFIVFPITFLHPFYRLGIFISAAGFIIHILIPSEFPIPFISSTNPERIEFDLQIDYS
jgi:hypothetical protein